jgi:hypothetical protein
VLGSLCRVEVDHRKRSQVDLSSMRVKVSNLYMLVFSEVDASKDSPTSCLGRPLNATRRGSIYSCL